MTMPELFTYEPPSGMVEPGDDGTPCVECGRQAALYVLDRDQQQIFTCPDHHGAVTLMVIRGELGA